MFSFVSEMDGPSTLAALMLSLSQTRPTSSSNAIFTVVKRVVDEFCHLCRTISCIKTGASILAFNSSRAVHGSPFFVPITIFGGWKKYSIATNSRKSWVVD